jgi:hypothetical protein
LILDTVQGRIELVALREKAQGNPEARFEPEMDLEAPGESTATVEAEWSRNLADRVRIVECTVEDGEPETNGIHSIRYTPGGTVDAFEILLADEEDRRARIQVDPVTGRITAIYD